MSFREYNYTLNTITMKEIYIIIKNPKENWWEKMKLWGKIKSMAWDNYHFHRFSWLDGKLDFYWYVNFEETTGRNRFDSDIIPEDMTLTEFIKFYKNK